MAGVRERARAELTAEIVEVARRQLGEVGPAELSLRAIAREVGMVSSAVYRYFPSRDHLLTRLIIDSYDRLGAAVEVAEAACRRTDFRGRWRAAAAAMRDWAFAHPSEWALIFGTPVPGYQAPTDTIGPATRYTAVLVDLLADLEAAGATFPTRVARPIRRDLADLRTRVPISSSDQALQAGMVAWAGLMGAVSLELFGHLHNVVGTPSGLFDAVVEHHVVVLLHGVPAHPPRRSAARH